MHFIRAISLKNSFKKIVLFVKITYAICETFWESKIQKISKNSSKFHEYVYGRVNSTINITRQ